MFVSVSKVVTSWILAFGITFAAPISAATLDQDTSAKFTDDSFDWLMTEGMSAYRPKASDPEALAFVAKLFRNNDERAAAGLQGYIQRYPFDPAVFDLAGTDLMRQQKYKTAAVSFQRAIDLDPSAHWTRAKLGTSLILSGNHRAGLAELEKVNQADPNNPLALRYLAWDALNNSNLPQAIIYSERALSTFGLPADQINRAHLDLARLYSEAGRQFDIMTLLGRAVRNSDLSLPEGVQIELLGSFFDAALALQNTTEAKVALDRLANLVGPETPQIKLSQARVLLQKGKAREAQEDISALRISHPEMATALIPDLALAEAANGNIDDAVNRLGALANVQGPSADLPTVRMALTLLLDANQTLKAYDFIDKRSATAPDRPELAQLSVEARFLAKDANAAFEKASVVETYPELAQAHFLLGNAVFQLGDKAAASNSLRRALELAPQNPNIWMTLLGTVHGHDGYAHDGASDHKEVEALLNDALAANPDSPLLYNELGLLYLSDGDTESAIEAFNAALERSPGYLSSLTLGALARADAKTDLETAEILITLAKQLMPTNIVIKDVEGWIAFQKGDVDKARPLINEALKDEPGDATTRFHQAILSAHDGDTSTARKDLLSALTGDLYLHYDQAARALLISIDPINELKLEVHTIDASENGVGTPVGSVMILQTDNGIEFRFDINGLPQGLNSAHVHNRPTCAPKDGVLGGAAGMHFGHVHSETTNMMPDGTMMSGMALETTMELDSERVSSIVSKPFVKPRGDLEPLSFNATGYSNSTVVSKQLSFNDLRARSLMIHEGLDKDGESGQKIACVVIP